MFGVRGTRVRGTRVRVNAVFEDTCSNQIFDVFGLTVSQSQLFGKSVFGVFGFEVCSRCLVCSKSVFDVFGSTVPQI